MTGNEFNKGISKLDVSASLSYQSSIFFLHAMIRLSFPEIKFRISQTCYFQSRTVELRRKRPRVITEHSQHVRDYEKI